ncbi:MAG: hypothetical protein J6T28_04700 [Paludibacteraceae bacterium]|nr:hypothetical protein [Paludibacteraceae bacterium]MBP5481362.1 hypothetical protein [Paludibacteraceae bacterium]
MAVDKKKIELLFQEWKKDSLLTRKGATDKEKEEAVLRFRTIRRPTNLCALS